MFVLSAFISFHDNPPKAPRPLSLRLLSPFPKGDSPDREKKSPVKHWGLENDSHVGSTKVYSSLFSALGFLPALALSAAALAAAFSAFFTESSLPSSSMIARSAPSPSRYPSLMMRV
jgi:hypothetical protein